MRHGESTSNAAGVFTGWSDVPLTKTGMVQAVTAGDVLASRLRPDVVHTSVLRRAVVTAELVLQRLEEPPVNMCRSWRLNERQYGALTGRVKRQVRAEVGEQRYALWRNSMSVAPPPMPPTDLATLCADPRYRHLPARLVPASESLGDVTRRLLPYWNDVLGGALRRGSTVLVVSHGNTLRALAAHLDRLDAEELAGLRIRPGQLLVYRFTPDLRPLQRGGERR